MTAKSPTSSRKYDLNFYRWVREHVEGGDLLNKCMQCGVCSGSCPVSDLMDHGPRKIFMMVRAGMKEEVLTSSTLFDCVSCYNCVVRCPRSIPVTHILQDLAALAVREGYAHAQTEKATQFAKPLMEGTRRTGRTDERFVGLKFFFADGIGAGLKTLWEMRDINMGMLKAGKVPLSMPHKIKGASQVAAIMDKAQEIQDREEGGE